MLSTSLHLALTEVNILLGGKVPHEYLNYSLILILSHFRVSHRRILPRDVVRIRNSVDLLDWADVPALAVCQIYDCGKKQNKSENNRGIVPMRVD